MEGQVAGTQQAKRVPWPSGARGVRDYLLFLPRGYGTEGAAPPPLLLFMHGAGERGSNVQQVKKNGPPSVVEQQPDFPFVLVSPQCPAGSYWEAADLLRLLDHVLEGLTVDLDRVYVTGLSMGGFATWDLVSRFPERFAAAVPVCGGGDADRVCAAAEVPIWTFHGDADPIVPVEYTLATVRALKACGGNVKQTIYPGVGHDSWTQTYENPRVYEWLLQHRLRDRGVSAGSLIG